ncbi:inositol 2-dehydrogenase [Hyalangium sp.]|uniref:inositol 2-dehydrogenase n=1 Tax=Hyalangium sp. TaxID=2028555 RepID=UPI002D38010D|nr:inositol 2-dehydrogenase [Hyalangium sp.]HYH96098.1 inositol 2-dehydrogenase [Hyalangium sp.]
MRIALLGAGRIGQIHAANIHHHPGSQLHAVVDVNAAAAKSLAERYGAKGSTDVDAVLADPAVEGVFICTSTDTHVELILKASQRKLPIFCEKPIDLDLAKVDTCLSEVSRSGVPLVLGFNRRFDPHFRSLRDAVRRGEAGDIEIVKITSRDPAPPPPAYVRVSGGIFRDMMIHDLDMARFLLAEEPVEIFATGSCLVDPGIGEAGDIDTAMVILKTRRGALCHIDNSRRAVYGYDQRIEVFGSKGMLQAANPPPTTVTRYTRDAVLTDKPYNFFLDRYPEAYRAELDHFLEVAAGRAEPLVTGHDGRAALVLADAALQSLKLGKPVPIPQ